MSQIRLAPAVWLAALAVTLAPPARAQSATTVELGKRTARSKYTLGRIIGLRELADGRVVVGDAKEGVFRMVDLSRGDVGLVGHPGDGPDDYRSAAAVLPGRGDSIRLYDAFGRKFLNLSATGTLAGMTPFTTPPVPTRRTGLPTAGDSSGALYYQAFDVDSAGRISGGTSTATIRRLAPGASADEDVLHFNTRAADQAQARGLMVFPFRDAWAVRSDGLVARVRADTYAVIWSRNGHEISQTGPLPYQPIPITTAEQQTISDSIHQGMKSMMSSVAMSAPPQGGMGNATVMFGGGGGGMMIATRTVGGDAGASPSAGANVAREGIAAGRGATGTAPNGATMTAIDPSTIPIAPFPAARPPIQTSGVVAIFDELGRLWVARERPRGDDNPRYDVIVEGQGVTMQVKLPAGTRLVGFGKGVVYLARSDDGSDWLERYAMR